MSKVSKYGVFSSRNTENYGPEKTPYLDTFYAVICQWPIPESGIMGDPESSWSLGIQNLSTWVSVIEARNRCCSVHFMSTIIVTFFVLDMGLRIQLQLSSIFVSCFCLHMRLQSALVCNYSGYIGKALR